MKKDKIDALLFGETLCEREGCTGQATNELYHTDGKGNVLRIEKICRDHFLFIYRNSIIPGPSVR